MDRLIALKGEDVAIREMRKHASWYVKGMRGASRIKDEVNRQTTREGMARVLTEFVQQYEERRDPSTRQPA